MLLAGLAVVVPPISAYYGAGAAPALIVGLTRLRLATTAALGFGIAMPSLSDFLGPGGGGPGPSPISTNPPPSLEATGASLAQLGKTEGPPRVSKGGSRSRRAQCKHYRWTSSGVQYCEYPRYHKGSHSYD